MADPNLAFELRVQLYNNDRRLIIAWVREHGEAIDMEREQRYCDPETGNVKEEE